MKFSTKTTYGLRAMIALASSKDQISLPIIAREEKISLGYLERIFSKLKRANLIKSEMGSKGGYSLAKPADKIEVYDIISALEGQLSPFHCVDESGKIYCRQSCKCGATKVLVKVQSVVNKALKEIRLSDLV